MPTDTLHLINVIPWPTYEHISFLPNQQLSRTALSYRTRTIQRKNEGSKYVLNRLHQACLWGDHKIECRKCLAFGVISGAQYHNAHRAFGGGAASLTRNKTSSNVSFMCHHTYFCLHIDLIERLQVTNWPAWFPLGRPSTYLAVDKVIELMKGKLTFKSHLFAIVNS